MVCQNITQTRKGLTCSVDLRTCNLRLECFVFLPTRPTAHATVIKQDEHTIAICMSCVVDNDKNKHC